MTTIGNARMKSLRDEIEAEPIKEEVKEKKVKEKKVIVGGEKRVKTKVSKL